MYPVQIVSLGPGEADLITVKALKCLKAVDYIFYPYVKSRDGSCGSKSLDILQELELKEEQLMPFHLPMSKDRSRAIAAYTEAAEKVEQLFLKDKKIAIVAEGDGGFYSSSHYIADILGGKNVPVEHIAGIPAFIACRALGGFHLTKQSEELNVLPGLVTAADLMQRLNDNKVVVIMKMSQSEEEIKKLFDIYPDADYHYYEHVGYKGKSFYTQDKAEIKERKFPYFSLMIIQKKQFS